MNLDFLGGAGGIFNYLERKKKCDWHQLSSPTTPYQRIRQQGRTSVCFKRDAEHSKQPFRSADTFITVARFRYFHFQHSTRYI